MRLLALLLVPMASSAAEPTAAATTRDVVSFNKAWRFRHGDPATALQSCPSSAFPTAVVNATCDLSRLTFAPLHNAEECRKACCSGLYLGASCTQWMFLSDAHGLSEQTIGCYLAAAPGAHCVTSPPGHWSGALAAAPYQPPATYDYAADEYDASSWERIDVPFDFVLRGAFAPDEKDGMHGYLPRDGAGWYRKSFSIPTAWQGSRVVIEFDGVFHTSRIWLNGVELTADPTDGGGGNRNGYTGFVVRIDGSHLRYEAGATNHLALRADASFGSGHWYEGGGIFRAVRLVRTHRSYIQSVFASLFRVAPVHFAESAINVSVSIVHPPPAGVITFSLLDDSGATVGDEVAVLTGSTGPAGEVVHVTVPLTGPPQLWSVQQPSLYTLHTALSTTNHTFRRTSYAQIDELNTTIGLREAKFDTAGFHLNGERVILRGFSDHNSFAGVGVAVPARVNLYRAQMLRAVGGNSWRMSHNPPDPALLDLLDALGILVWDETRDFTLAQVRDMVDLVKRDRNHPSIILWSIGNEGELQDPTGKIGPAMRRAVLALDATRPITANMNKPSSAGLTSSLDVQGVSHSSVPGTPSKLYRDANFSFPWFHQQHPAIPLLSSEGTTCVTQRGVNAVNFSRQDWEPSFNGDCISKRLCPTNHWVNQPNQDGGCAQSWTLVYDESGAILPYVSGTLGVWTLMDYLGEPMSYRRKAAQQKAGLPTTNWPQVSSSYGSFDYSGFPKPGAWHFRAWWLCHVDDKGRPPVSAATCSAATPSVKIVQDWRDEPSPPASIAVYTNAPRAELLLNGRSLGECEMRFADYCEWDDLAALHGEEHQFLPGNLTAVALSASGEILSTDTSLTPGAPARVLLSLDAPALATGTGAALLADGEDAALVRASIVDSAGRLCSAASHHVSFTVVSGPGRVLGVGNGDPSSHEPNVASERSAYAGLARAVVQVTVDAVSRGREQRSFVDADAAAADTTSTSIDAGVEDIVIAASAPGLEGGRVTIPVSTELSDSVLAVARRSVDVDMQLQ